MALCLDLMLCSIQIDITTVEKIEVRGKSGKFTSITQYRLDTSESELFYRDEKSVDKMINSLVIFGSSLFSGSRAEKVHPVKSINL